MCTRVTMKTPGDELARQFGVQHAIEVMPSYNLAPTDPLPVVRASDGERTLSLLRWGLVPFWAKDIRIGVRMVNARSETVAEKPAFRAAFHERRCLVVVDGFYEWKQLAGASRKQPFHIRRKDARPFAFAGLWERWSPPEGAPIESCTVITVPAAGFVCDLHDRMPAALGEGDLRTWLDHEADPKALEQVLSRADTVGTDAFEGYPVDPYVSNVRHDGPRCVERIELETPRQRGLFDEE